MKKHISVFTLYIRSTLIPVLLLFIITSAIQIFMFGQELKTVLEIAASNTGESVYGLESVFGRTSIPVVSLISLILLAILLFIPGTSFRSQTSYTLSRLQISPKANFIWQAVYNSLAFMMFWAAQATVMFALCTWYDIAVESSTPQTVFLALYRDEFLHSLIPLHEISRSIRNIAFAVMLGTTTAYDTYKNCFEKGSYVFATMLISVIGLFSAEMGQLGIDVVTTIIAFCIAGFCIAWIVTDKFALLFREENS